jgi:thiol-disulfide isomerase/thioredoxin
VNPIILNPDPLAILKESNKINDPTKLPRVKDAFTIIDGNRTKGSAWASDADFNASIKKNFDFTADNFEAAKLRAVKEGKPLVVVAGNRDSADSKQLIDGVVPNAKNGRNSAIYVFADVNKLDPNSELGRRMSASRGDTSRPYTAIFSPKADGAGNPQLEDHIANTWGARSEVGSIIQEQLGHAQTVMDARKGTFTVAQTDGKGLQPGGTTDRSVEPKKSPEVLEQEKRKLEDDAEARLAPDIKTVIDSFKQLKGANFTQREGLYDAASKAAAAIDPKDIALVKDKTDRDMKAEVGKGDGADKKTLQTLKARQQVLDLMTTAPSWINMNRGMSLMHSSQLDQGIAKIREGAKSNPEQLNNPQFIEQLLKTPYEVSKLKEKLPEVKFDEYLKHKKDGTLDKFAAENKPKVEAKVEPTVEPKVDAPPKTEKVIRQPEHLKYDGAEFQKGLEDAFNSGRRVVAKIGTPSCSGCVKMTKESWPNEQVKSNLEKNAIFADVNADKQTDIVEKYDVQGWPAVLVLEPYKDDSGKIQGRLVAKYDPSTEEEQKAPALNKFLTDNLVAPKPVDVPVTPPAKAEIKPAEVKPEVKPSDAKPAEVKPEAKLPDVKPVEVKPDVNKIGDDGLTAAERDAFVRLNVAQNKILAPLRALKPDSDAATMDAAFTSALSGTKDVTQADIKLAQQALARNKAKILAGDVPKDQDAQKLLATNEADSKMIEKIDTTEAYLNVSRGAVRLRFNPASEEGKADIRKGLDMRKELAQSPAAISKIKGTGIATETLNKWFPEVTIPEDKPVAIEPPSAEARKAAEDRLYDQHASNLQPIMNLPENATMKDVKAAYEAAIANSRKVNPTDIQTVVTALETDKNDILIRSNGKPTEEDLKVIGSIEQDQMNYSRIAIADGILQVGLGIREMTADPKNPETGIADVRKGLEMRKELLNDPTIAQKLKRAGFSDAQLGQWFPGLKIDSPTPQPQPQPQPSPKPQPRR